MFSVGDKIAHPLHGAGVIEGLETKTVGGVPREYYVMNPPFGQMRVLIPTDSVEAVGVRPVIDRSEAEALLASLPELECEMTQNWNKRYRENMLRIRSGDLMEVARVIKGLFQRDRERGLSTGERKMLRSAKRILISELVLVQDGSYEEIEKKIDAALV